MIEYMKFLYNYSNMFGKYETYLEFILVLVYHTPNVTLGDHDLSIISLTLAEL